MLGIEFMWVMCKARTLPIVLSLIVLSISLYYHLFFFLLAEAYECLNWCLELTRSFFQFIFLPTRSSGSNFCELLQPGTASFPTTLLLLPTV